MGQPLDQFLYKMQIIDRPNTQGGMTVAVLFLFLIFYGILFHIKLGTIVLLSIPGIVVGTLIYSERELRKDD